MTTLMVTHPVVDFDSWQSSFAAGAAIRDRHGATAVRVLRDGAGVKFKTIEAVLHGVPVVSTHVGAEGVGPDELFVQVADDPVALSDALVRVLTDPAAAIPVAEAAQRWAEREFSAERFVESVSAAWAL